MTRKDDPDRRETILEVAEELGATIFTAPELEQIRRQLLVRLGPEGRTTPETIAQVLAEAGMTVQRTSQPEADRYEEEFRDLLHFATLEDAEMCLIRLDELLRKFRQEGDATGEARVREVAKLGLRRSVMIARNAKVEARKRAEKEEVSRWFRVWLETPEAFFEWLELRISRRNSGSGSDGRRKLSPEAILTLTVEALDLGPDVKAIGLALVDAGDQEPVSGAEAAQIWSRALGALAGEEPWVLDFFSHLERIEEFCRTHGIAARQTAAGGLAVSEAEPEVLAQLLERIERETFGVRAGAAVAGGDAELEGELRRRGLDAYHQAYPRYLFCAICELETGSVTLVSEKLWASEVARRLRPALRSLPVSVEMAM